jgi:hypothetical protein
MKLKVIIRFRDKDHRSTIYEPGQVVSFRDQARCADLIAKGLAEEVKTTPKKTKKTK